MVKSESGIWPSIEGDGATRPKTIRQDTGKIIKDIIMDWCAVEQSDVMRDGV